MNNPHKTEDKHEIEEKLARYEEIFNTMQAQGIILQCDVQEPKCYFFVKQGREYSVHAKGLSIEIGTMKTDRSSYYDMLWSPMVRDKFDSQKLIEYSQRGPRGFEIVAAMLGCDHCNMTLIGETITVRGFYQFRILSAEEGKAEYASMKDILDKFRICNNCAAKNKKLLDCGRCGAMRYCSKECQRAHWPEHKYSCFFAD